MHGLLILVSVSDLGTSILAQSGPCIVRTSNGLPIVATMTLNSNSAVDPGSRLGAMVQHEMFHALGFGTIWTDKSLLGANHTFTGHKALAAAKTANGAPSTWQSVPVENTGGEGTIDSHWRKSYSTELMTGWINAGSNPLSRTTIESMENLGYSVDEARPTPSPSRIQTLPYWNRGPNRLSTWVMSRARATRHGERLTAPFWVAERFSPAREPECAGGWRRGRRLPRFRPGTGGCSTRNSGWRLRSWMFSSMAVVRADDDSGFALMRGLSGTWIGGSPPGGRG